MKWVPALLWPVLQPRARGWGLVFLALSALLSLAMLPLTIVQLQVLFGFGNRPVRLDYLVFVWSAVPWWWRHRDPFAFLRPRSWREAATFQLARARRWAGGFRTDPSGTATRAWTRLRLAVRRTVGLEDRRRRDRFAEAAARSVPLEPPAPEAGESIRPPLPDLAPADLLAPPRRLHHRAQRDRGQRVEDDAQREHDPWPGLQSARPGDGIEHHAAERDRQRRRRAGRHVGQAHVPARRGPRDDVGHQRPVDREEHAARGPEQRRPDERHGDRWAERGDRDAHRPDRTGAQMSGLRPIRSDSGDAGRTASRS